MLNEQQWFIGLCVVLLLLIFPMAVLRGESLTISPLTALQTRSPQPPERCPPSAGNTTSISNPLFGVGSSGRRLDPAPVLIYLNARGSSEGLCSAMEAAGYVRVQLTLADVTGDQVADVVLAFRSAQTYESGLLVFSRQAGQYVALMARASVDQLRADADGLIGLYDMNGNGIIDILFTEVPNVGLHASGGRRYLLLEWDGTAFIDLGGSTTWDDGLWGSTYDRLAIRPRGDGTLELGLTNPPLVGSHYSGSLTERAAETVWVWNGARFAVLCRRPVGPVQYRVQALLDGDGETDCEQLVKALAAYQQAIDDDALWDWTTLESANVSDYRNPPTPIPDPRERPLVTAYARYRRLVLYAALSQPNDAEAELRLLRTPELAGQANGMLLRVAEAFWVGYSTDGVQTNPHGARLRAGCKSALAVAEQSPALLAAFGRYTFTSFGLGLSAPAFAFVTDPTRLCPFA